jgi:beta-lactamase regulating signal transducer with metallopeptidase domain
MVNALLTFWLNALWQVTVLFLLGAVGARLLRRGSAAMEYRVWMVALLGACVTPLVSLLTFGRGPTLAHSWAWHSQTAGDLGLWMSGGNVNGVGGAFARPAWHQAWTVVAWMYALYIGFQLARIVHGWFYLRRQVAASHRCRCIELPQPHPELQQRISELRCAVRISDGAALPFAFGWRDPAIVVPRSLVDAGDDEKLTVVLGHELAHVERRDWVINLLLLVLSTPLSLHPCMALLRRRVEACREAACDELAAGYMTSRLQYGRALLGLAGTFAKQQLSLAAAYKGAALGVLDGSSLQDRIRRLMDRTPRFSAAKARILLFVCMAGMMALCIGLTSFALTLPSANSGSIAGVWTGKLTDRNPRAGTATIGHTQAYLQLQQKGSQITGAIGADAEHSVPIEDAVLSGNRLRFFTTMKQGDETTRWTVDLVVNGDQMSGTGHALRSDQHSWDVEIDLTRQQ